ncbi:MAG: hypothetical protein K0Q92_616 [Steroidobacteraceae bacterium]|jgi:hypothetical protein|nr:hypothetical protein [Steroidobacteraceae bacterium]
MATLPSKAGAVTLTDFAKSIDPDGTVATVINLLSQENGALNDVLWKEGNLPTGHQTTVLTGLPTSTWRKMYKGTQPSKSTRSQITDTCGILEQRSEIDRDVAELNGNTAAFRMSEADSHVEALTQDFLEALFYNDTDVNPERFMGLTPRYNTLNTAVGTSANVIDAGGTGSDNTSLWLVVWGENTITGIYPKGSQAGLSHEDLGQIDAFDTEGLRYRAYADLWKWKCGLSVRDWRYAVRIANIDVSDLIGQTGTQAITAATHIHKLMVDAMARIPNIGKGRPVFYGHRVITTALAKAALDRSQNVLSIENALQQNGQVSPGFAGAGTLKYLGVPVRTVDRLLRTEARVIA